MSIIDLNSGCQVDADCRDTFAECSSTTRTCRCKIGYMKINDVCKADLNSGCRGDADCGDTFAECITTTLICQCKMGYRNLDGVCKAEISCGNPPDIPGLALLDFTTGTKVGDTRYYICDNRNLTFNPESPASSACSSVTCQSNGKWTSFTFTCDEVSQFVKTNPEGSLSGTSGTILSPNRPGSYRPPDLAIYRYSIVTPGKLLVFTFNGDFGIDNFSDLSIYCGFDLDTNSASETFIDTVANPVQITCQTGCANILFFVLPRGSGSQAGFNITWHAIL
ncbi:hypothetical protein CHS0354_002386 [Potamilus streckersoni]|uniref:Sushi domain-containing protein n=1 Tax=Potamilus streckersoni TaxID=2493646 RepID=A0AAE0RUG2_9BIVA|nr:hypothetical protein CHS0354_002386 [Potamilus streckersoni]